MSDELSFTLNSPLTEEDWDAISDVDFDNTNEITFHTKHGKEVTFVKKSEQPPRKLTHFVLLSRFYDPPVYQCTWCKKIHKDITGYSFCPACGAEAVGNYEWMKGTVST